MQRRKDNDILDCLIIWKLTNVAFFLKVEQATFKIQLSANKSQEQLHSSSPNYVCQRTSHVANQASNVIHCFIMHNITSVFLLCKLFLLLFLSFPFLVLGYLGHLQPVGHLPVETKRTGWSQHTHTHTLKSCTSLLLSQKIDSGGINRCSQSRGPQLSKGCNLKGSFAAKVSVLREMLNMKDCLSSIGRCLNYIRSDFPCDTHCFPYCVAKRHTLPSFTECRDEGEQRLVWLDNVLVLDAFIAELSFITWCPDTRPEMLCSGIDLHFLFTFFEK